jgi:hypothetical protein
MIPEGSKKARRLEGWKARRLGGWEAWRLGGWEAWRLEGLKAQATKPPSLLYRYRQTAGDLTTQ